MANDSRKQGHKYGFGSKDWLDLYGDQQCISEMCSEVDPRPPIESLDGAVVEEVSFGVARETIATPRLKVLESAVQARPATPTQRCGVCTPGGNSEPCEPFGTCGAPSKNTCALSQQSAEKRVLSNMSDCSLSKTQGTNLEIPCRIEAVAPKNLHFVPISKVQATELIIKHHYLHRKCPISLAFGIKVGDAIKGVLTIGKPNSYSACVGVTGGAIWDVRKNKGRWRDVYELNRLWVSDDLPSNTESRFIGWVLRQLRKEYPNLILLSYADGEQNHVGYVYQATNWIYTGLSAKFTDRTVAGYNDHRSVPKPKLTGANVIRKERSRKHRYVMFLTSNDRALLAWKQLPYPKRAAH